MTVPMFRLGSPRALLAGGVFTAFASMLGAQAAAQTVSPPDFGGKGYTGWVTTGGPALRPPLSGPGPVVDDTAHPNISNGIFAATGQQPTFPVADLNNPILLPWVREELRKH